MDPKEQAATIDEYISAFPPETRVVLQELRTLIRETAPGATETISYAIPTFDLRGRHLVHFAGFDRHVGFYPTPQGIEEFAEPLSHYHQGKGSVQFPLDRPMPLDLIRRIVAFRVANSQPRSGKRPAG